MSEIRFYCDENINPAIAQQLVRGGIDTVHVRDLGELGDSDESHLERATQMGRVLITHDTDFLRLHAEGEEHYGIAFAKEYQVSIGSIVKALRELHESSTAEEMIGRVHYLPLR